MKIWNLKREEVWTSTTTASSAPQAFIRYRSNLYSLYFAYSGVMYNTGTKW